ncbi:MAG: hypothetical protein HOH66_06950 [Rhodospirillaceae bacterium]|jgi:hypothetical protein|nr:hypothetical protein [Rhodospirillaceae bacterium]MBT6117590.1 hypothetical protein [Rhodospirillaceae bacterium]
MDHRLIRRLVGEKLRERGTYKVAAFVGTLINAYGQVLVPWFRGAETPFSALLYELDVRPALSVFSIFLAYAFPLCVGVYSSVVSRYRLRRVESVADFPDRKPDPVFRASRSGRIVEAGATTLRLFERYDVQSAQRILGEAVWAEIVAKDGPGFDGEIHFADEGASYVVSHAPTADKEINVYLTRLTK